MLFSSPAGETAGLGEGWRGGGGGGPGSAPGMGIPAGKGNRPAREMGGPDVGGSPGGGGGGARCGSPAETKVGGKGKLEAISHFA